MTRAVRPTKRTEFTEADGHPAGKIVFKLEKESESEAFKVCSTIIWFTRELLGVALVNISNGSIFTEKGNTVGEGTKLKHV